MADTCGTLATAARTLKGHGAAEIIAICCHGLLSVNKEEGHDAIATLNNCKELSKLVVTNTVPISQEKLDACQKLETIDISPTLAEAVSCRIWL